MPAPAAALSMERAAPRGTASAGVRISGSFSLARRAISFVGPEHSFWMPKRDRRKAPKKAGSLPERKGRIRRPAKRKLPRIPADKSVRIRVERNGSFTRSAPYTKLAVKASALSASAKINKEKKSDINSHILDRMLFYSITGKKNRDRYSHIGKKLVKYKKV